MYDVGDHHDLTSRYPSRFRNQGSQTDVGEDWRQDHVLFHLIHLDLFFSDQNLRYKRQDAIRY